MASKPKSDRRHDGLVAGPLMRLFSVMTLVVGIVASLGVGSSVSAGAATTSEVDDHQAAQSLGAQGPGAGPRNFVSVIDHSARESVRSAYLNWHQADIRTPVEWTGNTATCDPGAESEASKAATESMVNYFRTMVGLAPVTFDPVLSARAQKAALLMAANSDLSHFPPDTWKCWNQEGSDAAAKSNIAYGITGAESINAYIHDWGDNNKAAGHRRWIFHPLTKTMGTGSTARTNALYVMGERASAAPSPVVAWPTSGYFPMQLEPGGRWSLSIPGADPSSASVAVTGPGGRRLAVTLNPYKAGYETPPLVWEVAGISSRGGQADTTYRVDVSGLKGRVAPTYSYDVTMFDANVATPTRTGRFVPSVPTRLFDTRTDRRARLAPFERLDVLALGQKGIPTTGVTAVVLNVTVADSIDSGYATVWPAGSPMPIASNLNFDPRNRVVANQVTVPVGRDGKISFLTSGSAHLLADVAGYYVDAGAAAAGRFISLDPHRLFDTRNSSAIAAGETRNFAVIGMGGVPNIGVSAVVLNLTATRTRRAGHLTVWPAGTGRPLASALNATRVDATLSNQVTIPVGTDGQISVYSEGGTDLLADIAGYFTDDTAPTSRSGLFVAHSPVRLLDSRVTPTNLPRPGQTWSLPVAGYVGLPRTGVASVLMNLTGVNATGRGHLTAWPYSSTEPLASVLNLESIGHTRANSATMRLGGQGWVSLRSSGGTNLLIDVQGHYLQ